MIRKSKKNDIPEFINKAPELSEFGFTEDEIKRVYSLYEKEKNKIGIIFRNCVIILCLSIFIYFFMKFIRGDIDFLSIVFSMFSALFAGFTIGLLVSLFIFMPLQFFFDSKLEKRFSRMLEYYAKLNAFTYWEQRSQIEFWESLRGVQFENELASLFKQANYNVSLTKASGDKGIDIILNYDDKLTIVQCKAHKNPVGPAVAREIFGALIDSKFDSAILASINGFTKGVYEFCDGKKIELWDINRIIEFKKQLKGI